MLVRHILLQFHDVYLEKIISKILSHAFGRKQCRTKPVFYRTHTRKNKKTLYVKTHTLYKEERKNFNDNSIKDPISMNNAGVSSVNSNIPIHARVRCQTKTLGTLQMVSVMFFLPREKPNEDSEQGE